MYCDAKEIRFRNREELTLKSKAKTFLIDILLDIVGGCFIAIGVYNFVIGKIYPLFAVALLFMAVGILVMLYVNHPALPELWDGLQNTNPDA